MVHRAPRAIGGKRGLGEWGVRRRDTLRLTGCRSEYSVESRCSQSVCRGPAGPGAASHRHGHTVSNDRINGNAQKKRGKARGIPGSCPWRGVATRIGSRIGPRNRFPLHASKVPVLVIDASDRASPQSARIDTGGPRLGSRVAASIHGTDLP